MSPRFQVAEDDVPLATEGLEVEEACDDDTIRRFMREWRRRVNRQLAVGEVIGQPGEPDRVRPAAH
jgi:hypothetical protein